MGRGAAGLGRADWESSVPSPPRAPNPTIEAATERRVTAGAMTNVRVRRQRHKMRW
jgi:hypothetical protein